MVLALVSYVALLSLSFAIHNHEQGRRLASLPWEEDVVKQIPFGEFIVE